MKQLVSPTRGQIIASLRGGERTVAELVNEVGLSGNAIRSHLDALERQGFVCRSGVRTGSRKPHNTYKLTEKGRAIFFEACEPLLNELFGALSSRLTEQKLKDVLLEAGRRLAAANSLPAAERRTKKERIDHAIAVLRELGGSPAAEKAEGTWIIQSASCPWAIVTAKHAEVCQIAEEFLSQLIGSPVRQTCVRGESPKCHFRIAQAAG